MLIILIYYSCSLKDLHITFGTVKNMSSREGNVLLLETILDECYKKSYERIESQRPQKRSASKL